MQSEMEKEKAVIVNEIRSVDDSPEEKGHDRYLREMWGDHPLSRKITGEVEEVQGISRDELARFYRERLVPSNTIIAVAGQFRRSRRCATLRRRSSRLPRGPRSAAQRASPSWKRKVAVVPDRFNQVQIYAGTCYPLDHDIAHYYTSLVFSTAFGESMSCRLFQKLREELGLCYTVYSFRSFFSDSGCGPSTPTPLLGRRGPSWALWTLSSPVSWRSPSAGRRSRTRRATLSGP